MHRYHRGSAFTEVLGRRWVAYALALLGGMSAIPAALSQAALNDTGVDTCYDDGGKAARLGCGIRRRDPCKLLIRV
jgi:hypothetical protein